MDNHSTCGLSARGLDLPDEGDVFSKISISRAEDAGVKYEAERTVVDDTTSVNNED